MKSTTLYLLAGLALATSGCATITSNELQAVSLSTQTADGKPVVQAKCTLKNDKGTWEATSPGFANVHRSAEDLMVECKKEGMTEGFLRAISRAAGGMWGNILFGGGVGAIIDHNKGTGYDYPNELPVKMGASTTVDKKDEQQPVKAQAGSPPTVVSQSGPASNPVVNTTDPRMR